MSTLNLAELATILTTQPIFPQYNLLMHLSNITLHFTLPIPLYHQCLSSTFQLSTHIHPTTNSSQAELGESVIFQPVLQAYPTRHSWIITVHVSLGNLECHWKLFNRQLTRTQQFLRSLDQHPSTPTQTTHYTPARIIQYSGHIQIQ